MSSTIKHNASAHQFETRVDDHSCVLDYSLDGDVMTITHTEVPGAVGGRGIAGKLVQAALTVAAEEGWKVVAACSYAADWMQRHSEYDELRA